MPWNAATNPYIGFVVLNESVTLNGSGFSGLGALANGSGNTNWAGPVILGSSAPNGSAVAMGAASGSSLIVSSAITDGTGQTFGINKVDDGTLILNNANTYAGATTVAAGTLAIRDSQALGTLGGRRAPRSTPGATLELEVDGNSPYPDPHGRDLTNDSLVGQTGNGPQLGLKLLTKITLSGTGVNGEGALYSHSGINLWNGTITLGSGPVAVGVDPDPHPSTDSTYFAARF